MCVDRKFKLYLEEYNQWVNFEKLNKRLTNLPGFFPFSIEQIVQYFNNPEQFSLGFNKIKGKGYLYGTELAKWRQQLFNDIPLKVKLDIGYSKLVAHKIDSLICDFCDVSSMNKDLIADIQDIGMGHTLFKYKLQTKQQVIVKQTMLNHADFFTSILKQFDFLTITLKTYQNSFGMWQLSTFLEGQDVSSYLEVQKPSEELIVQLAKHACISDVLGRGDRHLENYLLVNDILYALDISYMFWPDNEKWVDLYISGGQSECSVLALYPEYSDLYWSTYKKMIDYFQVHQHIFYEQIHVFYPNDEALTYVDFVKQRLLNNAYCSMRRESSERKLIEFNRKLKFKRKLIAIVESGKLIKNPIVMMYYWANQNRLTAFFLIETYFSHLYNKDFRINLD